jgi:SAM-dependent methyltransferase
LIEDDVPDPILDLNRRAWNTQVSRGNRWTIPVTRAEIEAARRGDWRIVLTPMRPVPAEWFPEMANTCVLCLASGGGQQGPILAAAGARVTVLDLSPRQLEQDRAVAEREGLDLETVEGDMADLVAFGDASFDLVIQPVSNCFVPDIVPVWRECHRVLKPGGSLLAGFINPVRYLFDNEIEGGDNPLVVQNAIPYSDLESLSDEHRVRFIDDGEPFEFGHTLEDQLGGQLRCGFTIVALYEDRNPAEGDPLSRNIDSFIATRAIKEAS